jgi:hypothetical protein
MVGKRFLPLLLAAVILILQGGDCVSLFFGDQQAHDCCHKGNCSPKNQDPCCQVTAKQTVTASPAKEKTPLPVLATLMLLPAWTQPFILSSVDPQSHLIVTFALAPPGQLDNFSLPLLV